MKKKYVDVMKDTVGITTAASLVIMLMAYRGKLLVTLYCMER